MRRLSGFFGLATVISLVCSVLNSSSFSRQLHGRSTSPCQLPSTAKAQRSPSATPGFSDGQCQGIPVPFSFHVLICVDGVAQGDSVENGLTMLRSTSRNHQEKLSEGWPYLELPFLLVVVPEAVLQPTAIEPKPLPVAFLHARCSMSPDRENSPPRSSCVGASSLAFLNDSFFFDGSPKFFTVSDKAFDKKTTFVVSHEGRAHPLAEPIAVSREEAQPRQQVLVRDLG